MKNKKQRTLQDSLKRIYAVLFVLTIGFGAGNIVYLWNQPDVTANALFFCAIQYVVILAILTIPVLLRKRFMIHIPLLITVVCALFGFVTMIMGDGLNFYGRFTWWDSVLHLFSGSVLAFVGLWIISIMFESSSQVVLRNKTFLAFYVLLFGLSCGAVWEVCEYAYDAIAGTNTQQFMATTTASIVSAEDVPLCGHEALRDTMGDMILNLVGSLLVAIFVFLRYDKLMDMHQSAIEEE
jgi:uncharacterized membrane protein YjdF